MDAAVRAELDTLRRRAYAPDSDLDEGALERLSELEDEALGERAAALAVPASDRPHDEAAPAGQDGTGDVRHRMTPDQSLGFWWTPEEQLRVVLVRMD